MIQIRVYNLLKTKLLNFAIICDDERNFKKTAIYYLIIKWKNLVEVFNTE